MAEYYVCSWGQALDAAVPAGVRNQAGTRVGTFLAGARGRPRQAAQGPDSQAQALAQAGRRAGGASAGPTEPLTLSDVCRRASCTSGPVLAHAPAGLVHSVLPPLSLGSRAGARGPGRRPAHGDEAGPRRHRAAHGQAARADTAAPSPAGADGRAGRRRWPHSAPALAGEMRSPRS